jgi:hypothetical protein
MRIIPHLRQSSLVPLRSVSVFEKPLHIRSWVGLRVESELVVGVWWLVIWRRWSDWLDCIALPDANVDGEFWAAALAWSVLALHLRMMGESGSKP